MLSLFSNCWTAFTKLLQALLAKKNFIIIIFCWLWVNVECYYIYDQYLKTAFKVIWLDRQCQTKKKAFLFLRRLRILWPARGRDGKFSRSSILSLFFFGWFIYWAAEVVTWVPCVPFFILSSLWHLSETLLQLPFTASYTGIHVPRCNRPWEHLLILL